MVGRLGRRRGFDLWRRLNGRGPCVQRARLRQDRGQRRRFPVGAHHCGDAHRRDRHRDDKPDRRRRALPDHCGRRSDARRQRSRKRGRLRLERQRRRLWGCGGTDGDAHLGAIAGARQQAGAERRGVQRRGAGDLCERRDGDERAGDADRARCAAHRDAHQQRPRAGRIAGVGHLRRSHRCRAWAGPSRFHLRLRLQQRRRDRPEFDLADRRNSLVFRQPARQVRRPRNHQGQCGRRDGSVHNRDRDGSAADSRHRGRRNRPVRPALHVEALRHRSRRRDDRVLGDRLERRRNGRADRHRAGPEVGPHLRQRRPLHDRRHRHRPLHDRDGVEGDLRHRHAAAHPEPRRHVFDRGRAHASDRRRRRSQHPPRLWPGRAMGRRLVLDLCAWFRRVRRHAQLCRQSGGRRLQCDGGRHRRRERRQPGRDDGGGGGQCRAGRRRSRRLDAAGASGRQGERHGRRLRSGPARRRKRRRRLGRRRADGGERGRDHAHLQRQPYLSGRKRRGGLHDPRHADRQRPRRRPHGVGSRGRGRLAAAGDEFAVGLQNCKRGRSRHVERRLPRSGRAERSCGDGGLGRRVRLAGDNRRDDQRLCRDACLSRRQLQSTGGRLHDWDDAHGDDQPQQRPDRHGRQRDHGQQRRSASERAQCAGRRQRGRRRQRRRDLRGPRLAIRPQRRHRLGRRLDVGGEPRQCLADFRGEPRLSRRQSGRQAWRLRHHGERERRQQRDGRAGQADHRQQCRASRHVAGDGQGRIQRGRPRQLNGRFRRSGNAEPPCRQHRLGRRDDFCCDPRQWRADFHGEPCLSRRQLQRAERRFRHHGQRGRRQRRQGVEDDGAGGRQCRAQDFRAQRARRRQRGRRCQPDRRLRRSGHAEPA